MEKALNVWYCNILDVIDEYVVTSQCNALRCTLHIQSGRVDILLSKNIFFYLDKLRLVDYVLKENTVSLSTTKCHI